MDDVVAAILARRSDEPTPAAERARSCRPTCSRRTSLTLGDLAGRIHSFREMQQSLRVPDFSVRFNQQLYTTYLSYCRARASGEYGLDVKRDARGSLAEFIKSPWFGQIFVSRTRPGVTRGNHYHHTKTEKFFVVAGEGLIRFRHIEGDEIHEYPRARRGLPRGGHSARAIPTRSPTSARAR